MAEKFKTTMSSKGQIVISKEIREELNLEPKQKFTEETKGTEIIIRPVLPLSSSKGILKGMGKMPTDEIIREVKKGWK